MSATSTAKIAIPAGISPAQINADINSFKKFLFFLAANPGRVYLHDNPDQIWSSKDDPALGPGRYGDAVQADWYATNIAIPLRRYGFTLPEGMQCFTFPDSPSRCASNSLGVNVISYLGVTGESYLSQLMPLITYLETVTANGSTRKPPRVPSSSLWPSIVIASAISVTALVALWDRE